MSSVIFRQQQKIAQIIAQVPKRKLYDINYFEFLHYKWFK